MKKWAWISLVLASLLMLAASLAGWCAMSLVEIFGFITGAVCVLLVVEENIWNWPIGIANEIFFVILFVRAHLYGDMTLQFIYIILSLIGWYQWLYGGQGRTELGVSTMPLREGVLLALIGAAATGGLTMLLHRVSGAAPFFDALTTVLSLVAQYLLTRKRIENWHCWIAADVIYVGLYTFKGLYLTAVLYAIFIGMCVTGLAAWRKSLKAMTESPSEMEQVA